MSEVRTAEHWRTRAMEARRIANGMEGHSKEAMLDVATAYDKLADITERSEKDPAAVLAL